MGECHPRGTFLSTEFSGNDYWPIHMTGKLDHLLLNRNETLDATHLCEFHHVEGVIADYGLTLGGLMEFMDMFFGAMGVTDLRYKPA
jgi:hypothetical protein